MSPLLEVLCDIFGFRNLNAEELNIANCLARLSCSKHCL